MQRWGKTSASKQRWRCVLCEQTGIRKRKDNLHKSRLFLFVSWLTGKATLAEVAKQGHVSVRTISRWFESFWSSPPKPVIPCCCRVLVLDATSVEARKCMLLIAGDADRSKPVSWFPVVRECYESWRSFLLSLAFEGIYPSVVVCDGQRGLLKAIHDVWPQAKIQRCLIHVIRQSLAWLTQHPKTRAGYGLLVLVKQLSSIRTKQQKRRWRLAKEVVQQERRGPRTLQARAHLLFVAVGVVADAALLKHFLALGRIALRRRYRNSA